METPLKLSWNAASADEYSHQLDTRDFGSDVDERNEFRPSLVDVLSAELGGCLLFFAVMRNVRATISATNANATIAQNPIIILR